MAPEQARGDVVDQRADLFSLGAVAWEMIAGTKAFPGSTAIDVLSRILTHEPELLASRKPDVPECLSRLVGQLLKKNVGERTSSSLELVNQIQRIRTEWLANRAAQVSDDPTRVNCKWRPAFIASMLWVPTDCPSTPRSLK
jgi:eukaryotic-like serine/threonine-protein kinase